MRGLRKQVGALIVAAFSCSGALARSDGTSNVLILNSSSVIPLHTVLAFSNLTEVEDYFGMASPEAAEATTFFSSPPTPKSQLMYARFHLDGGRARVFGAPTFNTRTLSQIQGIKRNAVLRIAGLLVGACHNQPQRRHRLVRRRPADRLLRSSCLDFAIADQRGSADRRGRDRLDRSTYVNLRRVYHWRRP